MDDHPLFVRGGATSGRRSPLATPDDRRRRGAPDELARRTPR